MYHMFSRCAPQPRSAASAHYAVILTGVSFAVSCWGECISASNQSQPCLDLFLYSGRCPTEYMGCRVDSSSVCRYGSVLCGENQTCWGLTTCSNLDQNDCISASACDWRREPLLHAWATKAVLATVFPLLSFAMLFLLVTCISTLRRNLLRSPATESNVEASKELEHKVPAFEAGVVVIGPCGETDVAIVVHVVLDSCSINLMESSSSCCESTTTDT